MKALIEIANKEQNINLTCFRPNWTIIRNRKGIEFEPFE